MTEKRKKKPILTIALAVVFLVTLMGSVYMGKNFSDATKTAEETQMQADRVLQILCEQDPELCYEHIEE